MWHDGICLATQQTVPCPPPQPCGAAWAPQAVSHMHWEPASNANWSAIQALKRQFPGVEGKVIYLSNLVSPLTSEKPGDTHTPEASAAAQLKVAASL